MQGGVVGFLWPCTVTATPSSRAPVRDDGPAWGGAGSSRVLRRDRVPNGPTAPSLVTRTTSGWGQRRPTTPDFNKRWGVLPAWPAYRSPDPDILFKHSRPGIPWSEPGRAGPERTWQRHHRPGHGHQLPRGHVRLGLTGLRITAHRRHAGTATTATEGRHVEAFLHPAPARLQGFKSTWPSGPGVLD